MKKTLLAFGFLALLSGNAGAAESIYEKGASSATATGITCSTGTSIRIDGAGANLTVISGITTLGFRFQNQHDSCAVWLGYTSSVSSSALSGLGLKLTAGSNAPIQVGYDTDRKRHVEVHCLAADACGAGGANISRETFGWK